MQLPHLIAVIDDDTSLCHALTGLLRSAGYVADGFASADQFLATARTLNVDCIITDIQMPGMSGIDLKQHLVARGCTAPVIMITGRDDAMLLSRAEESGALCILRKPFDADRLMACILRAIGPGI